MEPGILLQFRKASAEKLRDFDIQKVVDQYLGQLWSIAALLHSIPQPLVLSPHTFIQPPAQVHR